MEKKKNVYVRLVSITIEGLKNVSKGTVDFSQGQGERRSSVTGIYGQNGSGKTALINALEILKAALTGTRIPGRFSDIISVGREEAIIGYVFDVKADKENYRVFYDISLMKGQSMPFGNMGMAERTDTIPVIAGERLYYSYSDGRKTIRKTLFFDTTSGRLFGPKKTLQAFLGNDRDLADDVMLIKGTAYSASGSFVFSAGMIDLIRKKRKSGADESLLRAARIIETLAHYGNYELFIVTTRSYGYNGIRNFPLGLKYEKRKQSLMGEMVLPIEEPCLFPESSFETVKKTVEDMNKVLSKIIPGLFISVADLGQKMMQDGTRGRMLQLVSLKNGREIPLAYESDGIKKIICMLQLLIVTYNESSCTVAIDELDAGVFEYLLGEILRVIYDKGKGQLIFTSHNLRPLEVLDYPCIVFTTTDPSDRYTRIRHLKDGMNLRDFYFRDIVLGEQDREIYAVTNDAEIALAFKEAGMKDAT